MKYEVTVTDSNGDTHGVLDEVTTADKAKEWAAALVQLHTPEDKKQVSAAFQQRLKGRGSTFVEKDDDLGMSVEVKSVEKWSNEVVSQEIDGGWEPRDGHRREPRNRGIAPGDHQEDQGAGRRAGTDRPDAEGEG